MKGKYKMALIGIFVPLLVYISAIRLGASEPRWAKKRYGEKKPRKQAKASAGRPSGMPARADHRLAQRQRRGQADAAAARTGASTH